MTPGPVVCIVDDDESLRESLESLLSSVRLAVQTFASGDEYLAYVDAGVGDVACLVLDVTMPGMSGPQLQEELVRRGANTPIVFLSALANDELQRRVLALGAHAYLIKPFEERALLDAIQGASRERRGEP